MTKSAKKFRSVMCGVVSFLLSLSLTLGFMLASIKVTALNPDYAVKMAEKSSFSKNMQAELKEEFISYGNACNVDEVFFDSVFADIITTQQITTDFSHSIKSFYSNRTDEIDTVPIEEKLLAALEEYAGEKGFASSESLTQSLTEMSEEMGDLYSAYIAVFQASYFTTASSLLARACSYSNYAVYGIIAFVLVAALIIRLSFKKAKNYLRYYIYALSGSTLMLAVAPAVALIMKIGNSINIANASLYGLASMFINGIFITMLLFAAVMAVLTVVVVLSRNRAVKLNK